jgi:hypothetical protein
MTAEPIGVTALRGKAAPPHSSLLACLLAGAALAGLADRIRLAALPLFRIRHGSADDFAATWESLHRWDTAARRTSLADDSREAD